MASVLASPGTPSSRICPFDSSPISSVSTRWLCPTMTLPISVRSVSTNTDSRSIRSLSSLMLMTSLIVLLYVEFHASYPAPGIFCPQLPHPPGANVAVLSSDTQVLIYYWERFPNEIIAKLIKLRIKCFEFPLFCYLVITYRLNPCYAKIVLFSLQYCLIRPYRL